MDRQKQAVANVKKTASRILKNAKNYLGKNGLRK
jgi:hypothetical protein